MSEKSTEVNYKKNFCEKYFDKGCWDLDVLNQVDVLLKDKKENILLYIESKFLVRLWLRSFLRTKSKNPS